MGYWIKTLLGAALFFGGVALFNIKLVELLEVGTCASGNQPFEISRPCPEGTGAVVGLMMAGIFIGMVGIGIYAFRGDRPGGEGRLGFFGFLGDAMFAWGFFFAATGASSLHASLTSETIGPDGELGGGIVGVIFLLMGLPALAISLWGLVKRDEGPSRRGRSDAPRMPAMPGGGQGRGGGGSDQLEKLERLDKLRKSGALTDSEFEQQKARLLGG